jgi:hypothetical protein
MDYFSHHLVDPENDDWMIHFVYITGDAKRLVANQLMRSVREVEEDLQGPMDDDHKYRAWLAVIHGDLDKREGRDFSFLDPPQIEQVYDYITIVLQIPLPPFNPNLRESNEHLWKFFSAVHSTPYRYTIVGEPDVNMQETRQEYERVRERLRGVLLEGPHREWVEDLFFKRGSWIAKNELQMLRRAHGASEKIYNLERGQDRFEKLFSYHGQRAELVAVHSEWMELARFYVRPWLDDCRRQASSRTASENVRSKCRAILQNADALIGRYEMGNNQSFDPLEVVATMARVFEETKSTQRAADAVMASAVNSTVCEIQDDKIVLPSTLSSFQRLRVHEIAKKHGFSHASETIGADRRIVLRASK